MNPLVWFLPCFRNLKGDGLRFEVRPEFIQALEDAKNNHQNQKQGQKEHTIPPLDFSNLKNNSTN